MRKLDWTLSVLQILSILLSILAAISFIALYHHQTEDYITPFTKYIQSVRIAIPPLALLASSYILYFLMGEKVSETPKLILSYLRDEFLQHKTGMKFFLIIASSTCAFSLFYIHTKTPPYYELLISKLLGGEQDRQQIITKEINEIKEKNINFSKNLKIVTDVFILRSNWNFNNKKMNTTEPRILVRALEANNTLTSWNTHPLRKHALGEAYLMWAQAAKSSAYSDINNDDWKDLFKKSISSYQSVIDSQDPLATKLMKNSAANNIGNAYLYIGEFDHAENYYKLVLKKNKNLSTASNLIVALVKQQKIEEALSFGEEMIEWGKTNGKALNEGSSYSGVVGNTAFVYLINADFQKGARLMLEAFDLESDDLNTLNLAVALYLSNKINEANDLLEYQFKYPALTQNDQSKRVLDKYNSCFYLVKAAFTKETDIITRATYLYTYLGIARTPEQLNTESENSIAHLIIRAKKATETDGTCNDLLAIPKFNDLLSSHR